MKRKICSDAYRDKLILLLIKIIIVYFKIYLFLFLNKIIKTKIFGYYAILNVILIEINFINQI